MSKANEDQESNTRPIFANTSSENDHLLELHQIGQFDLEKNTGHHCNETIVLQTAES